MKTKYYKYAINNKLISPYWWYAERRGEWYTYYNWGWGEKWEKTIFPNIEMEEVQPEEMVLNNIPLL